MMSVLTEHTRNQIAHSNGSNPSVGMMSVLTRCFALPALRQKSSNPSVGMMSVLTPQHDEQASVGAGFQSLSRDDERSDKGKPVVANKTVAVPIPQSG